MTVSHHEIHDTEVYAFTLAIFAVILGAISPFE
jgi:hypothetical protein